MMPLYLYVLMGSAIIPFLFSIFKLDFILYWRNFVLSTTIVAVVFLIWDAVFTQYGIWGFSEDYCLGFDVLKMPIEEWLFFFVIPYCSLFTHFAFYYAYPKVKLNKKVTISISMMLMALALVLVVSNYSKAYTVINFSFLLITIAIGVRYKTALLQQFYISFMLILIPFILVNGILTGSFTETPVVWYNHSENLGIRILTIPIEDFGYAFTLLFGNLMIFDTLNRKRKHI
ncbi:MAG: lycopene cyclase domain-containing protein [Bacteroidia bacterium]|jgi:lycopene cyclase domain-containing protein